MGGAKKLTPEQFDRWRREFGTDARSTPLKPSERPENTPENPLERIAAEGFDRALTPPPFATIALASALPIGKVSYGALVGALVTIGVAIAKNRGVNISPEVAGSVTLIGTAITAYLVPLTHREIR
jgi:hypothetical protein